MTGPIPPATLRTGSPEPSCHMRTEFDIAIVGGGLVGLSLAVALQHSGLRLALIEPHPFKALPRDDTWDSRIYAVSPGTASFLETLSAWNGLPQERLTRVEAME